MNQDTMFGNAGELMAAMMKGTWNCPMPLTGARPPPCAEKKFLLLQFFFL